MAGIVKGLVVGFAIACATMPAAAKVVKTDTNGFVVSESGEVQASPEAVWAALTHPERWWSKEHSWTGDARNFSMTLKPGGCFCEALLDSGFAEHSRIVFLQPNKLLRLSGAFGPLQGEALVGTLTVRIKPGEAGKSNIAFEYVVGGYSRIPLTNLAPLVDGVIAEQHRRLLKLVASGSPD